MIAINKIFLVVCFVNLQVSESIDLGGSQTERLVRQSMDMGESQSERLVRHHSYSGEVFGDGHIDIHSTSASTHHKSNRLTRSMQVDSNGQLTEVSADEKDQTVRHHSYPGEVSGDGHIDIHSTNASTHHKSNRLTRSMQVDSNGQLTEMSADEKDLTEPDYVYGEVGVNACPDGFSPIQDAATCIDASNFIGDPYQPDQNDGDPLAVCNGRKCRNRVGCINTRLSNIHRHAARWLCKANQSSSQSPTDSPTPVPPTPVPPTPVPPTLAPTTLATSCFDDVSRRRTLGITCSDFRQATNLCSVAQSSRRRNLGGEVRDTCASTCDICEADQPLTASPTQSPTQSPSQLPTQSPTFSPTQSPTQSPSQLPTQSPTFSPTQSPTQSPSQLPTQSPTFSPTQSPTQSTTRSCNDAVTPHEITLLVCPSPALTSSSSGTNNPLYNLVVASVIAKYDSLSSTCNETDCERGDFSGAVLRMTGHDFMDWNGEDGTGGSDGCIDFEDPDNAGLKPTLCGAGEFGKGATLNAVYENFCDELSYADFLVIAAEAMMIRTRPDYDEAHRQSPTLSFNFTFGRTTATSCPKVDGKTNLPNPEDGCPTVDDVFNIRLGLNSWRASAALMGVHTLGRMRAENSGYEGWWNSASGGNTFNNDYYHSMTVGWVPKKSINGDDDKNGWIRGDSGPSSDLFLDTDLCLYQGEPRRARRFSTGRCAWTFISNSNGGNLTGNFNFCVNSSGLINQEDTDVFGTFFQACCSGGDSSSLEQVDGEEYQRNQYIDKAFATQDERNVAFFPRPEGAATQDIIDFALNETMWLTAFTSAWKHVTENNLNL